MDVANRIIYETYEDNCPIRIRKIDKDDTWWNCRLRTLKKESRKLYYNRVRKK